MYSSHFDTKDIACHTKYGRNGSKVKWYGFQGQAVFKLVHSMPFWIGSHARWISLSSDNIFVGFRLRKVMRWTFLRLSSQILACRLI